MTPLTAASIALVLIFAAIAWLLLRILSLLSKAPYVTVPEEVLPEIVAALEIRGGDAVYDLGCGDGRVIEAAFRARPEASFVGIDKNLAPYWAARWKLRGLPKGSVSLEKADFFRRDLSGASRIFIYLMPGVLERLLPKLEKELRPGARVVSCDYPFRNRKAGEVIDLRRPGKLGKTLYVYDF